MNTIDISELSKIDNLRTTDRIIIIRNGPYLSNLSYVEELSGFSSIAHDKTVIGEIQEMLNKALTELSEVSSSMLTKTDANETYVKSETVTDKKALLLTNSEAENIITKYVTNDDLSAKQMELYADAANKVQSWLVSATDVVTRTYNSYYTQKAIFDLGGQL